MLRSKLEGHSRRKSVFAAKKKGLCFYCAGKHIIAQCPVAKPRTARIQAIDESSENYQAQTSLQGDSA